MRQTPRDRRLYSSSIGTLWAVKLILLLRNRGSLLFEGDLGVWEGLEQMSDSVADTLLAPLREAPHGAAFLSRQG